MFGGTNPNGGGITNDLAALFRQYQTQTNNQISQWSQRAISDIESRLAQIQNEIQNAVARAPQAAPDPALLRKVDELTAHVSSLQQRTQFDPSAQVRPRSIDDIAGVRTLQWYRVDVDFDSDDDSQKFGSTQIQPEGPFVVAQIQSFWQCRDEDDSALTDLLWRYVPISGTAPMFNQVGGATATAVATNLLEIPELSLRFAVAGSGRFWANANIPGAAFYGWQNPQFTAMFGWIDRTDSIQVYVTPERNIPHKGRCTTIFHGFQILTNISLAQFLGFAQ